MKKNDAMLTYMLDAREAESTPEIVDREKYEPVKKRQEEKREEYRASEGFGRLREKKVQGAAKASSASATTGMGTVKKLKLSAAAVFVVLCVAAISLLWDEKNTQDLKAAVGRAVAELTEQKLPDAEGFEGVEEKDSLVADGMLTEILREENAVEEAEADAAPMPEALPAPEPLPVPELLPQQAPASSPETVPEADVAQESVVEEVAAPVPESYVIQRGDTLIGLSIRKYGNDDRVAEICSLNEISDPDDIKVGQKILLP